MLGTESDVAGPNPGAAPSPVAPAPVAAAPVVAPPPATAADASRAVGAAQEQMGTDIAAAEDQAAKERVDQLRQQQLFQETHAKAIAEATRETADAFKAAKEAKVPEFYATHHGNAVVSAIAAGLGGAAYSLGKMSGTSPAEMIQGQINDYYRKEKDKIDNLYKYAEQKGKLTGEMRYQYAQDLTNLQTAMAATNMSAAEKIRAIAAASKGKVDKAEADLQAKILEAKSQKDLEESQANKVKLKLTQAETAAKYADIGLKRDEHDRKVAADEEKARHDRAAEEAKAKAAGDKTGEALDKRAKEFRTILYGTARSPGPAQLHAGLQALENTLTGAINAGDKDAAQKQIAAAVLAIEQGSRATSGSAPTKTSTHLLTEMQSLGDTLQSKWGQISGNPTASKAFLARLRTVIQGGKKEQEEKITELKSRFEKQELDPASGLSVGNPELEARARKHLGGFGVSGGEGQGVPVTVKMKDGSVVKALKMPDGKLVRAE